jgi:hypothetical protein
VRCLCVMQRSDGQGSGSWLLRMPVAISLSGDFVDFIVLEAIRGFSLNAR